MSSSKQESTTTRPPPRRAAERPPRAVAQVPQAEPKGAVPSSEAASVKEEKPAAAPQDDEVPQATEMMAAVEIDEAEEPTPSGPCAHCGKHGCSAWCGRCRAVYYCSQALKLK